jgi:hypothetical protein
MRQTIQRVASASVSPCGWSTSCSQALPSLWYAQIPSVCMLCKHCACTAWPHILLFGQICKLFICSVLCQWAALECPYQTGALCSQVPPDMHIVDVLTELSSKGQGCVLVAEAGVGGPLAGTFTDGDLRRGLQVGSGGGVCHTDQPGLNVTWSSQSTGSGSDWLRVRCQLSDGSVRPQARGPQLLSTPVADVMTRSPRSCTPGMKAIDAMQARFFSRACHTCICCAAEAVSIIGTSLTRWTAALRSMLKAAAAAALYDWACRAAGHGIPHKGDISAGGGRWSPARPDLAARPGVCWALMRERSVHYSFDGCISAMMSDTLNSS